MAGAMLKCGTPVECLRLVVFKMNDRFKLSFKPFWTFLQVLFLNWKCRCIGFKGYTPLNVINKLHLVHVKPILKWPVVKCYCFISYWFYTEDIWIIEMKNHRFNMCSFKFNLYNGTNHTGRIKMQGVVKTTANSHMVDFWFEVILSFKKILSGILYLA